MSVKKDPCTQKRTCMSIERKKNRLSFCRDCNIPRDKGQCLGYWWSRSLRRQRICNPWLWLLGISVILTSDVGKYSNYLYHRCAQKLHWKDLEWNVFIRKIALIRTHCFNQENCHKACTSIHPRYFSYFRTPPKSTYGLFWNTHDYDVGLLSCVSLGRCMYDQWNSALWYSGITWTTGLFSKNT